MTDPRRSAMRAWSVLSAVVVAAGASFEGPATFEASKILPANLAKGPHYKVEEPVKAEGYYQQFQLTTDYGALAAEGRTVLNTRIRETAALAQLAEVSKGE